jgi:aryl-alcohol dehydrogenase-like predicted oxidoreductase
MEIRDFGKTGLMVTPIGLGMAALGRPGYINLGHASDLSQQYEIEAMEANTHQVINAAWQAGIRYFDAARSYGRGESFLGNWLKKNEISFGEVTIGSKWGYTYTANWQVKAEKHEVKEHTLPVLQRQWRESEENLSPYLKLYQIHSATLDSGVLENKEVLNHLIKLKQEGLKIGLSLSGENQKQTLQNALAIDTDGILLFDAVQATWNVLEPSVGKDLRYAAELGMGVIIKEVLANGRLTNRNQEQDFKSKKDLLQSIADKYETSIDALAMAAALQQPFTHVVLSGATTEEQLQSNIKALQVDLDSQEADHLIEELTESPGQYWQTRKQLEWN